jgi:hypothetical protein
MTKKSETIIDEIEDTLNSIGFYASLDAAADVQYEKMRVFELITDLLICQLEDRAISEMKKSYAELLPKV